MSSRPCDAVHDAHEQRYRVREVAAPVREERVVDAAVDDRGRRLEGALGIGRLDLEGAVDDERPGRPPARPARRRPRTASAARRRRAAPSGRGRTRTGFTLRPPPDRMSRRSTLTSLGSRRAPFTGARGARRRAAAASRPPCGRGRLRAGRFLRRARLERVRAARVKAAARGRARTDPEPRRAAPRAGCPLPSGRGTAPISASRVGVQG